MKVKNDKSWQVSAGSVQLGAVVNGILVGLATAMAGGIVLGALTLQVLAVETHLSTIAGVWGVVSVLAGAFSAGRRAGAKGWLNGGLTGIMLVLVATGLSMIIARGTVTWLGLGRNLLIGLVGGAVAGTIGVNIE
ncbi:MAG: TIGR04086 family membrane protein [Chloroflexota bacterium]